MSARLDELTTFLRESLGKGIPRSQIEQALVAAGWPGHQIHKAMTGYADVEFPVPVPRPAAQASAGEAFLYLVLFSTLGTAAFSVVELIFRAIEIGFPDPADPTYRGYLAEHMRWAIARVAIAFPVFLLVTHRIARMLQRDPTLLNSPVRRWLTYIAMFLAVLVLVGDFVFLVAMLLRGDTTTQVLLKALAVAAATSMILGYYLADLRANDAGRRPARVGRILLAVATVVAAASMVTGVLATRPPAELAAERVDDRRVAELGRIARAINDYNTRRKELPTDLAALAAETDPQLPIKDPVSGEPYEYLALGTSQYHLCAVFARRSVSHYPAWHPAGRYCFDLNSSQVNLR